MPSNGGSAGRPLQHAGHVQVKEVAVQVEAPPGDPLPVRAAIDGGPPAGAGGDVPRLQAALKEPQQHGEADQLLAELRQRLPQLPVLLMTAFGDVEKAFAHDETIAVLVPRAAGRCRVVIALRQRTGGTEATQTQRRNG